MCIWQQLDKTLVCFNSTWRFESSKELERVLGTTHWIGSSTTNPGALDTQANSFWFLNWFMPFPHKFCRKRRSLSVCWDCLPAKWRRETQHTALHVSLSHYFHAWGDLFWCEWLIVGDGHMARTHLIFLAITGIAMKDRSLISCPSLPPVLQLIRHTWFYSYASIFQIFSDSKFLQIKTPFVFRGLQSIIVIFRQLFFHTVLGLFMLQIGILAGFSARSEQGHQHSICFKNGS